MCFVLVFGFACLFQMPKLWSIYGTVQPPYITILYITNLPYSRYSYVVPRNKEVALYTVSKWTLKMALCLTPRQHLNGLFRALQMANYVLKKSQNITDCLQPTQFISSNSSHLDRWFHQWYVPEGTMHGHQTSYETGRTLPLSRNGSSCSWSKDRTRE